MQELRKHVWTDQIPTDQLLRNRKNNCTISCLRWYTPNCHNNKYYINYRGHRL